MNNLGKITLSLAFFIAIIALMLIPSAFGWGEAPTMEDGDGILEEDEQVWVEFDDPIPPEEVDPNSEEILDAVVNTEGGQEWLNESPGGIDGEGTQLEVGGEYEIGITYDWEGNSTGVVISGVSEEEPVEIPEDWEPPGPEPVGWTCTPYDGENTDKISDSGQIVDCGTTSAWSAWSCKTANTKERTRTVRGCSAGNCYYTIQPQTVNCPYGCSAGKCQPLASFTMNPNPVMEGETVTFEADNSRDSYSGTNLAYEWYYDGTKIGEGQTLAYTIPSGSVHQVELKVTSTGMPTYPEDNGTTDTQTQNLTVREAPHPVINAPDSCIVPCNASIDAIGTLDAEDSPNQLTYEWDYDYQGNPTEPFQATYNDPSQPGTHLFNEWKTYTIRLRVTDTDGLWTETTKDIEIQNNPPNADFKMIPTPASGITPLTIQFVNQTTDPDGHSLSYQWDFGAGEGTSTQENPTHIYNYNGTFTVTLTATDEYGATSTATGTVNPKQKAAITLFTATNPETKNDPTDITTACNKTATVQIEYLNKDNTPVTGLTEDNIPCTDTPTAIQKIGFPEPGIYLLKATITSEECENCPKTKHIIVRRPAPEIETPEIPIIMAIGIALAVLLIIERRK